MTAHDPNLTPRDDEAVRIVDAAMALADAAADCPKSVRVHMLERLLDELRPGWPIPAFMGRVMSEARFWADMASQAELRAYGAACWERMSDENRKAFAEYLSGKDKPP